MNQTKEKKLKKIAKNIRLGILEEVHAASSGHPGGSLSIADILAYLYWEEMNVRPDEPDWADRDRLVLSKGHTAPAIYAALAEKGYLPKEDLKDVYDGYPYPLGFGVSPDGGTEPDYSEGKALASMLFEAGVRLFDVTMGNPYFNPHVNRPFARGGYEAPEPPLRGVARILEGAKEIRSALPEGTGVVCSGLTFLGTT